MNEYKHVSRFGEQCDERSDYVLLLDDDAEMSSAILADLVACLEADRRSGGPTPRIVRNLRESKMLLRLGLIAGLRVRLRVALYVASGVCGGTL